MKREGAASLRAGGASKRRNCRACVAMVTVERTVTVSVCVVAEGVTVVSRPVPDQAASVVLRCGR
jgi:hypothetical protein